MTAGLFDHTPISLSFPHCPRGSSTFKFFDMWAQDEEFSGIIRNVITQSIGKNNLLQLMNILKSLKSPLKTLNRDKSVDIHQQ